MDLIRPRLTDYHGIHQCQADLDFAIQFFDEDIPLYVDPFLLWKSPSQQDQALHSALTNSFNRLNYLVKKGRVSEAENILMAMSECNEVGLGVSKSRKGQKIGKTLATKILGLFEKIPEYSQFGFTHFEVIQLYVEGVSKDRISDYTCNFLKSFLIDYTIDQCAKFNIPIEAVTLDSIYNYQKYELEKNQTVTLPINPLSNEPIIFTPKRWLRFTPWINYDDYFKKYCPRDEIVNPGEPLVRVKVLDYNRENYGTIEEYVTRKIKQSEDCKNDPLFSQLPITSAKRKFQSILKLPSGKENSADKKYEDICADLLASLFYPSLDFAQTQSRTVSGRHIRDLIFYNNRDVDFLNEIFLDFQCKQLVFEMKNVAKIKSEHINQLSRYLTSGFGSFGVLLTRNPISKAMFSNTIDLWSSQRKCIIVVSDEDLRLMVDVYESKQRLPIEVLKKKYLEFIRGCPS